MGRERHNDRRSSPFRLPTCAVESANFSAVFLRVPAFHFAPFRVNGAIILKWHRVSYLKTGRMVFSRYQVDVTVNRRISMQSFSMSSCVFLFRSVHDHAELSFSEDIWIQV